MAELTDKPILTVENLTVDFPKQFRVLDGVELDLKRGEILGLVGESGSGKSVLARTLLRLESPGKIVSGRIMLDGMELTQKSTREMRAIRGKKIALAMQDPRDAMDPVFKIGAQFREVLSFGHFPSKKAVLFRKICGRLANVGISQPEVRYRQYPHQWSRGMLQRGQLAMVFATQARILVLDEVTSALDPTVIIHILHLIRQLRRERNVSIILITHDIFIVSEICDRVAVMRHGCIVEKGSVRAILSEPSHAYTRQLVALIRKGTHP